MQRTADFTILSQKGLSLGDRQVGARWFGALVLLSACVSAALSTWLPLQLSIVSVFLFAGPHNWFELRYFMMRLPVRFGRSRNFFLLAFSGIGVLTLSYVAMPTLYYFGFWQGTNWPVVLASWNTALLLWLGVLIWQRGKQKLRRDWSWAFGVAFALCSVNWLAPEIFSLAIVYAHPLVALWFLDRHLKRNRPEWLTTYRRCLYLLPILLGVMIWQLSRVPALGDDNGLFWRITQHAGAELLPGISSHMLVSVHVFLEMLHYGVWIVALPLIGARRLEKTFDGNEITKHTDSISFNLRARAERPGHEFLCSIPLARHPRGFPKLVASALLLGIFAVVVLWAAFSLDYSTTRDIYFTVAIAHVLAEAPFLLRMI